MPDTITGRPLPDAVVVTPQGDDAKLRTVLEDRPAAVFFMRASDPEAAHASAGLDRTLLLQHSGTFLVDDEGIVRYEKTAALPTGSFSAKDLRAALASPGVAR
jgi:hypothetical protein